MPFPTPLSPDSAILDGAIISNPVIMNHQTGQTRKSILRSFTPLVSEPVLPIDPQNEIMTRSKSRAFLLGSLLLYDRPSTVVAPPVVPVAQPQLNEQPSPPPATPASDATLNVSTLPHSHLATPPASRPVLSLPYLTPTPPSSFLLPPPDNSATSHLRISPQTITSTNPLIFSQMPRPDFVSRIGF